MKKVRPSREVRRIFRGSSGGFTLIEVLVALALFGIIAITFLGGLTTASRAVFTGDVRTTAESLARTQMEYVKGAIYDDTLESGHPQYSLDPGAALPGYTVVTEAVRLDPENDGYSDDDGIQEITVIVSHEGRVIFTLEGYKVDR